MYPVENGFYHLKNSDKETTINYLRITESEYNVLRDSAEDKGFFTYLLYTLGIVDRWEKESLKAIKQLEALTGNTWENPYKPENERFTLKLTDEERTLIGNRIKDGYYTSEAIQARKDQKKREEYEKKRNEIIADFEKEIQKAENRKLVRLAVLDTGISLKNVIYYNHSNELAFNWNDYEEKVTQEQFDKFIKTVDKTKLPENITFKLKKL
jgi:hypothetical protein